MGPGLSALILLQALDAGGHLWSGLHTFLGDDRLLAERARERGVRIHDLRHTFASTAVASGQGLPMIGKLLGHTQVQTTARYAHLAADPVKLAADAVSSQIAASLQG